MSQTQGLKEFMVERMGVDTAYMDDFIKGLNDGANTGDDKKRLLTMQVFQIGQTDFYRWLRVSIIARGCSVEDSARVYLSEELWLVSVTQVLLSQKGLMTIM